MGGYGKRFGSSMATGASTEFFAAFLMASLFDRDPRYFVSLGGGPWRRLGYGISRLVVTGTDAGREGINWPGIVGPLVAESLANGYLPVAEQGATETFRRYGVGLTASVNALKEYWPTIVRNLRIARTAPGRGPDPEPQGPQSPTRFLP